MDDFPVCVKHTLSDVMPHSGRCCACIEENNAEAKPYLEVAHTLAQGCRDVLKYVKAVQEHSIESYEPIETIN